MRIVVGITGASGAIYGIKLLQQLKNMKIETHLILSKWARRTIELETEHTPDSLSQLADCCYEADDQAAPVSSGSFLHQGMVIVPCSMKTLSAVAHGYTDNLISRAADVTIKENRKLILVPRESPLSSIHLENMLKLASLGVTVMPPMPAFYHKPKTIEELVLHTIGRILDHLAIDHDISHRWTGLSHK
ncbi:3-octaprenyl-4-hydroxybenzoate carboxy-lyase [Desulfofarcimen acetoxidans DSM 771]|uniref:Flavin prenyltransferase UbiX n=1 Tax=Desulfofarcimen acetoxidans (strain ATCC 49208 / DSM 771 / KCTC 5769 / VKM B-1644 / 5575) TaxID=485916 RepID=C8W3M9_DESAS|nr:UbiX family flavin prenyltransferase [Desulfofarcimen acetoxidans]ACV63815.1 3-octaprenyl-4-hydroxybenzoate carboxy-lyase [Desulfofarcimen acetoxidans DSM 771]